MYKFILYGFVVIICFYNTFCKSYEDKMIAVNKIRCYLSLGVADDARCTRFVSSMSNSFVIWSTLKSKHKNIDLLISDLEVLGWKDINITEDSDRIYYKMYKNDIIYEICDYKNTDEWDEDIHEK